MFLMLALGLAACGGGGSSSTPTPAGTSVDLTSFKNVFLGTSSGAQYSFPALFGSDSQGRAWSGSFTVVADGATTFDGLSVTKRRSLVTLQLAGGAAVSGTTTSYFRVSDGSPYKSISSTGVTYTATSEVPIPTTAKVGDFGILGVTSGSDGTTSTATWSLDGEFNGASILTISSTIKSGTTITSTETDSFFLNAFGVPTKLVISATTNGFTVNLSGSSN
jgi:hypothetical protein